MAQLAIKGHKSRGNEVIEILEMLGGKNLHNYCADCDSLCFYIGKETNIIYYDYVNNCEDMLIFTLEEFEQKFPYKVGDKIIYKIYGIHSKIKTMLWNVEKEQVFYRLESNKLFVATADELKPYKKEVMEEIKVDIPKGYEFAGVDDDKQQVVFTKVGYHYPQTYNECCKELGHPEVLLVDRILGYKGTLLSIFQKLLICRDAYWKIAGEQMGLGKPWKPDYTDKHEKKYAIWVDFDKIRTGGAFITTQMVLTYPTSEIRDAFYENFKDLIESCKELL